MAPGTAAVDRTSANAATKNDVSSSVSTTQPTAWNSVAHHSPGRKTPSPNAAPTAARTRAPAASSSESRAWAANPTPRMPSGHQPHGGNDNAPTSPPQSASSSARRIWRAILAAMTAGQIYLDAKDRVQA